MVFACDYCGKTFSRRQNLTYHLVSHGIGKFPSKFTGGRKTPLRNVTDQKIISNKEVLSDGDLLQEEIGNSRKNVLKRFDNSIKWTIAYGVIFAKGEERTQPHQRLQRQHIYH